MSDKIEDILLTEIRLNRSAIDDLRKEVSALDKDVFSNKIKLSLFIGGISLFSSIIIAVVIEKLKSIVV